MSITITGKYFRTGCTVKIGGVAATNVVFVSSTTLTCTPPAGAGYSNVVVTNPDGFDGTLVNGYGYEPIVDSVSPSTGYFTGGDTITISGHGFAAGVSATVGGASATNVSVLSDTSFTCITPSGSLGLADIVVNAGGALSDTLTGSFTYTALPPVVNTITPNVGTATGSVAITIDGANFASGCGVTIGGVACTSVSYVSDTQITAVTPAASLVTLGAQNVVVTNTDLQTGTKTGGYTHQIQMSYECDAVNEWSTISALTYYFPAPPYTLLAMSYADTNESYPYGFDHQGNGRQIYSMYKGGNTAGGIVRIDLVEYIGAPNFVNAGLAGASWFTLAIAAGTDAKPKIVAGKYGSSLIAGTAGSEANLAGLVTRMQAGFAGRGGRLAICGLWGRDLYASGELTTLHADWQTIPPNAMHLYIPGLHGTIAKLIDYGTETPAIEPVPQNAEAGDINAGYPGV